MIIRYALTVAISLLMLAFTISCSGISNPVETNNPAITPAIDTAAVSSTGIFGVYDLTINPDLSADLISKRTASIGESFLVNGIVVFTMEPCKTCLQIKTIDLDDNNNLVVTFTLDHPFPMGSASSGPVSAVNRCDLNVFDTAMLVYPKAGFPATTFTLGNAYSGYCVDPDGYSASLSNLLEDPAAIPYFLVVDESGQTASSHKWNRFEMGAVDKEFDIVLNNLAHPWSYELMITMGYGASARKFKRFTPKYYNPEFNKKEAWKVVVVPPQADQAPDATNTWSFGDTTTTHPVTVKVYDWQQNAVVSTKPNFADAQPAEVFAASKVASVKVEIPGMITAPLELTSADSGLGVPGNPLVYVFDITNELNLAAGEYPGIVKVTDGRTPSADLPPTGKRDFLIHSETGLDAAVFKIPEYATYQVFVATVV